MWEAQIKAALKAAGMDESLFSRITVTKEVEIAAAVQKLQREIDSEKVIKVLEDAGLKDVFEKVLQSKVDQIVDKKLKTLDTDAAAKAAKDKADADKAAADKLKTDGMSESDKRFQALMDTVEKLTGKIQSIEETSVKATRAVTIKESLKSAGLPENLAKYVTGENEAAIKEQIDGLKSDLLAVKQAENDAILSNGGVPGTGSSGPTATEAAIVEFAKGRVPSSAGGGGLASQQVAKTK